MWKCNKCGEKFIFPELKRPDAGLVNGVSILGLMQIKPLKMCPECFSLDIEQTNIKEVFHNGS